MKNIDIKIKLASLAVLIAVIAYVFHGVNLGKKVDRYSDSLMISKERIKSIELSTAVLKMQSGEYLDEIKKSSYLIDSLDNVIKELARYKENKVSNVLIVDGDFQGAFDEAFPRLDGVVVAQIDSAQTTAAIRTYIDNGLLTEQIGLMELKSIGMEYQIENYEGLVSVKEGVISNLDSTILLYSKSLATSEAMSRKIAKKYKRQVILNRVTIVASVVLIVIAAI